jgi:hypothetical protein
VIADVPASLESEILELTERRPSRRNSDRLDRLEERHSDSLLHYIGYSEDKNEEPWWDDCLYFLDQSAGAVFFCDKQGGASGSALYDKDLIVRAIASSTVWNDRTVRETSDGLLFGDVGEMENIAAPIDSHAMRQLERWVSGNISGDTFSRGLGNAVDLVDLLIENKCSDDIWFAARFLSSDSVWQTGGFWTFEPGSKERLFSVQPGNFYFHAFTDDRSYVFEGDDFLGPLHGANYGFRKRVVRGNNSTISLSCSGVGSDR